MIGKSRGELKSLEVQEIPEEEKKGGNQSSVINMFKGLVSGKTLQIEDVAPALDKLRDHLISKNVASEVAVKLCDSVAAKLEGKVKKSTYI